MRAYEVIVRRSRRGRRAVTLTLVDGRGVNPGVDLDNGAALLDVMERPHGPA